jgi:hypothetical protein
MQLLIIQSCVAQRSWPATASRANEWISRKFQYVPVHHSAPSITESDEGVAVGFDAF